MRVKGPRKIEKLPLKKNFPDTPAVQMNLRSLIAA